MKKLIDVFRDNAGRIISYHLADGVMYQQVIKRLWQYEQSGKSQAAIKKIIMENN